MVEQLFAEWQQVLKEGCMLGARCFVLTAPLVLLGVRETWKSATAHTLGLLLMFLFVFAFL